jgi:hypothetical protein
MLCRRVGSHHDPIKQDDLQNARELLKTEPEPIMIVAQFTRNHGRVRATYAGRL